MQALASKDIEVNPLSLRRLFESSFYTIDVYQREYAWGEEEVRTLVTDLREAFDDWSDVREYRRKPERAPQYFLGPFVYYEQPGDLRSLVDGQQRFTTLHLIFMALRVIGRQLDEAKHVEMLNVGHDEEKLNDRWRHMLAELTAVRDDHSAPGQFLKATLQAWYSRLQENYGDMEAIDTALNLWVRRNNELLGLTRPDRFHEFVEQLVDLANIYRTFLHASRNLREGLEEIFFNEKNGLSGQMTAILAAIRPGETPTDAKEKARRIAAFIDRWYVLRTLSELPVQQRDLMELIRSPLPGLRHCRTADDVSDVLARYLAEDAQEQVTLEGFGLRGTNRHQIKYLLARLTAYAMQGCGHRGEVDEYLNEAHPYQIEHLFANKPERHRKEVPDGLPWPRWSESGRSCT
jgi:hypothetical protein